MRKYRNDSNEFLHIDCLTRTVTLQPGAIAALPLSRDVRYYSRLKKLTALKDKKKPEKKIYAPKFVAPLEMQKEEKKVEAKLPKKRRKKKSSIKEDIKEQKPMKMENE